MTSLSPYIALTRLDKPIGILLLLWPCLWGIGLASGNAWPDARLILLFTLGAIIMRSAGCVVNDMADRNFDGKVTRTKTRPLVSGALSMKQASLTLAILLAIALLIVLQLPTICFYMALAVLPLVAAYPFMKRITWWPQAFLGITFNSGALFGWAAVTGTIETPAIFLYVAGIFWTLGYDTIYAHQDKDDDALIGVKSTARKLGTYNRAAIGGFYSITMACLFAIIGTHRAAMPTDTASGASLLDTIHTIHCAQAYVALLSIPAMMLAWQVTTVTLNDSASCHTRFKSNQWVGAFIAIGCILG